VDVDAVLARVQDHIRRHELIPPGGDVTVLVSGGADSSCAWHALRELGYGVSALHVNHGLRGRDSDDDAAFCRAAFDAEVVDGRGGETEEELRRIRYGFAADRPRATGHTLDDEFETVLYRLVSSGSLKGIKVNREDGVVRPLLCVWRADTEAYCRAEGISYRTDATNARTKRGLIRAELAPLLEQLHPAAKENLIRAARKRRVPAALLQLLDSPSGSGRLDLGGGTQLVREYGHAWLERGPVALDGPVRWGEWTIETELEGLKVRGWRAGDRLAGRSKKIQDVFVDAKIPRSHREAWPLVVRGDEVVAVPGVVEHPQVKAERAAD
jgi:tRNA(Ile)-lysidine synthetase-like protein